LVSEDEHEADDYGEGGDLEQKAISVSDCGCVLWNGRSGGGKSYDCSRETETAARVFVKEYDEDCEQGVQNDGNDDDAMDGAFHETKYKRPSIND